MTWTLNEGQKERKTQSSTKCRHKLEQMDQINLEEVFLTRTTMLKIVPHFLWVSFRHNLAMALQKRHRPEMVGDNVGEKRTWTMLGLLPLIRPLSEPCNRMCSKARRWDVANDELLNREPHGVRFSPMLSRTQFRSRFCGAIVKL